MEHAYSAKKKSAHSFNIKTLLCVLTEDKFIM